MGFKHLIGPNVRKLGNNVEALKLALDRQNSLIDRSHRMAVDNLKQLLRSKDNEQYGVRPAALLQGDVETPGDTKGEQKDPSREETEDEKPSLWEDNEELQRCLKTLEVSKE